jgi:glycosyltransferase involved in cell wall biosynthesis
VSKVLLICPEPLGHQHPAGVGIRFLEFARGLAGVGHEVTVLSPDGGEVAGARSDVISTATIARETSRHDIAVVQGHVANELFAHGADLPVVVDLYDPFIIENLHYYPTMGEKVFQHDFATLMRSLRHGDFFLCASEQQRLFYLGVLMSAGRVDPKTFGNDASLESLIRIVPFGVPPLREIKPRSLERPAILFGGVYDWYDPMMAIDAVAMARKQLPHLTLTFTRHPNAEITPQSRFAEAIRYASDRGYEFVRSEPWVPYAERGAFYDRFALALLTFNPSLETDLSMRTRIFDFLWAGIPVVSSPAPGTDAILRRYDAGVVVDSRDARVLAAALTRLLMNQGEYASKLAGTQKYAADHQWPRLLEPLTAFCANPRAEARRSEVVETRQSLLGRIKTRLSG